MAKKRKSATVLGARQALRTTAHRAANDAGKAVGGGIFGAILSAGLRAAASHGIKKIG